MPSTAPPHVPAAFGTLRHALDRRRLAGVEPRLRVELAGLGLLVGAFLFWQARVPLHGVAFRSGAGAALGVTALFVAGCGAIALGVVAARHRRRLLEEREGPPWLSLPIAFDVVASHLEWESRRHALWLLVPGLALVAACVGLVPAWGAAALALELALALWVAAHAGVALARASATGASAGRPGDHPLQRMRDAGVRRHGARGVGAPAWTRSPLLAQLGRDLALSSRATPARGRLVLLLGALAGIGVAWFVPIDRDLATLLGFSLSLGAGALLAEWIIDLSGLDPFTVVRALPLGPREVWVARAAWAVLGALVVAALLAFGARRLPPGPLQLLVMWRSLAVLAIGVLGVNYAVTLFPRAATARRLLGLALALAVAASLMIPLLGWIVLLTAVFHSARRVPRWFTLEDVTC